MKKYKKLFISIISGLLLMFFLIGCGSSTQTNSASSNGTSSNDNTIVYITKSGKKYHSDGCEYLSKSKISITLKEAKEEGYTPCSKCNPPQ